MGGMLATWDYGDVRAWAAAKGYVRAQGPEEAVVVVCVDVCGWCYHRGSCGRPEDGPPPMTTSGCEGCATPTGAMPCKQACVSTPDPW